jgi:hypothetical protein
MAQKPKQKKGAEAPETPALLQPVPVRPQRIPAMPEEQAAIQARAQRSRAEIAILKQRFAETDVAKTIAEAECNQLIQQLQAARQTIEQLTAALAEKKSGKKTEEPTDEAKE